MLPVWIGVVLVRMVLYSLNLLKVPLALDVLGTTYGVLTCKRLGVIALPR